MKQDIVLLAALVLAVQGGLKPAAPVAPFVNTATGCWVWDGTDTFLGATEVTSTLTGLIGSDVATWNEGDDDFTYAAMIQFVADPAGANTHTCT